eukprot:scaffold125559_cov66-Phaeocystis_antarctica.AAC.2
MMVEAVALSVKHSTTSAEALIYPLIARVSVSSRVYPPTPVRNASVINISHKPSQGICLSSDTFLDLTGCPFGIQQHVLTGAVIHAHCGAGSNRSQRRALRARVAPAAKDIAVRMSRTRRHARRLAYIGPEHHCHIKQEAKTPSYHTYRQSRQLTQQRRRDWQGRHPCTVHQSLCDKGSTTTTPNLRASCDCERLRLGLRASAQSATGAVVSCETYP